MNFKNCFLTLLVLPSLTSCKFGVSYSKLIEEMKDDTYCEFYLTKSGDGYLTSYYNIEYFNDKKDTISVV